MPTRPSSSPFGATGDFVDYLTTGYRWIDPDGRTSLNWSISDGWGTEFWIDPDLVTSLFNQALSTFAYYTNLEFAYSGYFDLPTTASSAGSHLNLSFDRSGILPSAALAVGYFPNASYSSTHYPGAEGDIYLNALSSLTNYPLPEPGNDTWLVLLHEIGHTLGLKHSHDDGGTGRPLLRSTGNVSLDQDWFTIMSYNDQETNRFQWDPDTPMIGDVIALQFLYGKNNTTNAGDTLHVISDRPSYRTLWDASGNDVVDIRAKTEGWYVELPDIQVSNLVDTLAGIAISVADFGRLENNQAPSNLNWLAGDFEGVYGGAGSDEIVGNRYANNLFGNAGNDRIEGGLGNDRIDGGAGLDSAYFNAAVYNKSLVTRQGDSQAIVDLSDYGLGVDQVWNVENLVLSNATVHLTDEAAQVYRLYQAAFARTPDNGGLSHNIDLVDGGMSLKSMSNAFNGSAEFIQRYGSGTSDQTYINALYNNVLGRDAEAAGLSGWQDRLNAGTWDRADVLIGFSESPENINLVADAVEHGVWIV